MPAFPTEAELFPTGDLPPATAKAKFLQWLQASTGLLGSTGNAADARTALGATATGSAVFTATDAAAARTAIGAAAAASLTYVPVRQTVLSGSVDANGSANFLSAGSGLSINLSATSVPVAVAFAAGFGANGAIDYVGRIVADVSGAWSGLPASSGIYLYIERNASTGVLSYGYTALAPNYGYGMAKSTVNGQHTFRIDEMKMYVGNGSAAIEVQRVFVGECITGASSVSGVTTYALRGRYDSGLFAVVGQTSYSKNHNLGVPNFTSELHIADDANGTNERLANMMFINGPTGTGYVPTTANRLSMSALFATNVSRNANGSTDVTSGYTRFIANRGW